MFNNRINIPHFTGRHLGGTVGDALGWSIEFMSVWKLQAAFGPHGIQGFVRMRGNLAEITDDTQMALFTAEGMLCALGQTDAEGGTRSLRATIYQAYLRWLRIQGKAST